MNNYNLQVDANPEVVELGEVMVATDNETLVSEESSNIESDHELVDDGDDYEEEVDYEKHLVE